MFITRILLRAAVLLGGIATLLCGCGPKTPNQIELPVAGPLRLDGVTIVDTKNGALAPGMSIWMDRGRIVRITATFLRRGVNRICSKTIALPVP